MAIISEHHERRRLHARHQIRFRQLRMNCFVIMPFAPEFDDVYNAIKNSVESVTGNHGGVCFRIDEYRPAGRITNRLIQELDGATFCIADLTGHRPDVMWEVGYAMALRKPTIIITQNVAELPFDIHDMQKIEYSRHHLSATLSTPLKRVVGDTLGRLPLRPTQEPTSTESSTELSEKLLDEIAQLKQMVADAVRNIKAPNLLSQPQPGELEALSGHWLSIESGTHAYARIVQGELVVPYCFGGHEHLTGIYYDWRHTGSFWFARYKWVDGSFRGFAFLRQESVNVLEGAWWSSEFELDVQNDRPPKGAGVPATWEKRPGAPPKWAEEFFARVSRHGLKAVLAQTD